MYNLNKCHLFLLSLLFNLCMVSTSIAEPHSTHDAPHGKSSHKGHHQDSGSKHNKKQQKSSTFSPHWAKSLSDEQKISFDKMHLLVGQFEAVQRAKIKMIKAELNVLTAKESKNQAAIYAKIDEILEVKKSILRNRYDHIVEMRNELTEQQRISYDMGILKRDKHKH